MADIAIEVILGVCCAWMCFGLGWFACAVINARRW
jgi:hypothetical protein